ncbi:MAG: TonB-dependent receptor plug domain-containing protein, partial [Comamonas sp.]
MPSRRLPRMRAPAHWRPTVLAMAAAAVSLTSGTLLPLVANAQPATQVSDKALRSFSIPAAAMETALNQLAREAQIMIAYDPELVQGKQSRGFKGVATIQGVLDSLLESHPLQAQSEGQGAWRIRSAPARALKNPDGVRAQAQERNMGEVTVVAKKDARQQVFETAGSVAVVTREEIDRLPPRNTADVLAEVPGVYTSQSRMDPGVSVNIRGMQDFGRVNVMIDGTRQNYQQSGHGSNGSVYLDPEMIGGVDISKGPTSTVGGAGMIAGVVNFRTLEADDLVKDG